MDELNEKFLNLLENKLKAGQTIARIALLDREGYPLQILTVNPPIVIEAEVDRVEADITLDIRFKNRFTAR